MESPAPAVMALLFLVSRSACGSCGECCKEAAAAFGALTGLPAELLQEISEASDSRAALTAIARSGQVLGEQGFTARQTAGGALRLEGTVNIEKSWALAVLEFFDDSRSEGSAGTAETPAGMPVLAFLSCRNAVHASDAEPLSARISGSAPGFNPMCALSLEDAARLERARAVNEPNGESLPKGLFAPGAAGVIRLEGGSTHDRAAAAGRILRRAGAILLRRLDIARAYAAEGGTPGKSSGRSRDAS